MFAQPNPTTITEDTLRLAKAALGGGGDLAKAGWTQPGSFPDGIQNWSLDAVAKSLFPVITPLRNRIPRKSDGVGVQANWKAITGINTGGLDIGVSDGNRGGISTTTDADYFAAFRQLGLEDFVTWGAQLSAEGFLDLRGRSATDLLWAMMIAEEKIDLAGNTSLPLGQGAQPSAADVGTGGAIAANATVSIIVAPLTLQGYASGSVADGVRGQVQRTNADGSSDTYGGGTGKPSANRTVTTANDGNATHSITTSTAPIAGAMGYAWFWGAAGNETLGAITTLNSVVITTAAGAGTQTATSLGASDNSTNALIYDGILTQVAKVGGGFMLTMPTGTAGVGTGLTADGSGAIVEIDAALQSFWDNYRLSPSRIWVSSQEQRNITKKVLAGNQNAAQRFIINVEQGNIKGGDLVTSYLNKFTMNGGQSLPIMLHPNMPPGTIMFDTDALPYPLSGVNDVLVKRLRQDYNTTMWPPRSRKYEYGVYFDGVLQNYFPPAFGYITNIGNS
jgi:hypothetical protein